jgi:hypothetical protein
MLCNVEYYDLKTCEECEAFFLLNYSVVDHDYNWIPADDNDTYEENLKENIDAETYDAKSYDDHMQDAHELARIVLRYFDKCYLSLENAESIEQHIDSLEGCGVMEEADYKRYNLRR